MSIFIKDIDMPTEYGICITIFPDGRVTGEFSEMVIGHAVDGETIMSCDKKGEKHGKWINNNHQIKCSICGSPAPIRKVVLRGEIVWEDDSLVNYCPNCGAKMTERSEE